MTSLLEPDNAPTSSGVTPATSHARAVYTGIGSTNDARNFAPAPPLTPPHDVVHWAGDYLYYLPGPVAP